ncbi:hypothetical protein SO802_006823 [Lithocarpus litseifolius]|uniref:Uncharacterized protein n=1 Tax=Lithocarpus litseifolius TaxID=425828 RepID=A0AAW2DLZ6_9ROSI
MASIKIAFLTKHKFLVRDKQYGHVVKKKKKNTTLGRKDPTTFGQPINFKVQVDIAWHTRVGLCWPCEFPVRLWELLTPAIVGSTLYCL